MRSWSAGFPSLAAEKAISSMRYSTSKTAGHGQPVRCPRVAGRET
jgi:hypothetical protein